MCTKCARFYRLKKRLETEHLIPAPQVSHTGSHSSLLITSPCTPVLLATAPLRGPSAPRLSAERKASAARHRSAAASSPRGTCLRDATTGAASVRCHRSIPTHCGTCLRFALAGAAHSRQPLPRQSVIGTFPHPRSAAAAVRCAGKATVPCSFLRSAALTITARLSAPSKSSSLHRSAHRTPGTPRCRRRLPISAPLTQLSAPIFVTVFSFLAAGSLLTYNNQLRFVTFRQTLCRLFPYGLPLGLPSRLPPRLLLHLHAIAAGRNHLQPIAGKIIQSHPVFSDFLRVISVFSSPRCPYFLAVFRFLFQQRVGTMRKTCFHKHPD